jgi:Ni2+-binding GTPase involved in maturation of urease and hydrogenase
MTRFALLGGFLGAGKTTLIGQIARRYTAAGKTVGIITNDQAADLVDTQNLRSQGFSVGEVAGACFCCSFDEMVATADRLAETGAPDLLLAEPVGSCTDLVATIVLPLGQILGDRFELAPFGVLLKPSHGQRILAAESGGSSPSGFSPQAEYIFRKQLEEADYLMIGRADTMDEQRIEQLRGRLADVAPGVPVIAVSPKTGLGVEDVIGYIESPMQAGRRLLQIDYDTYAEGEAELGWVNLTATLLSDSPADLDACAATIVREIGRQIIERGDGAIAHVKASLSGDGAHAVANLVDNFSDLEIGLSAGHPVKGKLEVVVNARVSIDPKLLQTDCELAVGRLAESTGLQIVSMTARSLRPGRPTPTHRVTAG